jgi:hypothetical protein
MTRRQINRETARRLADCNRRMRAALGLPTKETAAAARAARAAFDAAN